MAAEGRLDRVVHLAVGMHRPLSLDLSPRRFQCCTPWAGGGRGVAQPATLRAGLQMEIVLRAMTEIFEVLDIEIIDSERHAEIFAANSHFVPPSTFPRHSRESGNPGLRSSSGRPLFMPGAGSGPPPARGDKAVSCQPRRMTIDEAVDGLAQPRLALTSTFLT